MLLIAKIGDIDKKKTTTEVIVFRRNNLKNNQHLFL